MFDLLFKAIYIISTKHLLFRIFTKERSLTRFNIYLDPAVLASTCHRVQLAAPSRPCPVGDAHLSRSGAQTTSNVYIRFYPWCLEYKSAR